MTGVQVSSAVDSRALRRHERLLAASLTARAMRDNPTSIAIFGADPLDRLAGVQPVWTAFYHGTTPAQLGAFHRGCLLAAAAAAPPGRCVGSVAPEVDPAGPVPPPGNPRRSAYVRARYAAHDMEQPHWHVGPVAVEPQCQGRGIGTLVVRALIEIMDASGIGSWLETDTEANVRFYRALGWRVAAEAEVLGTPQWFLHRPAPTARH
jgi:ribosomal protein S18 acetylase RimI-like enzyme